MNKLQLFVLLQDTVTHLKFGNHLAPNYHYCKQFVLDRFGYPKNSPSIKLLVCIGAIYIQEFDDRKTFEDYISKHNLIDKYNKQLIKQL